MIRKLLLSLLACVMALPAAAYETGMLGNPDIRLPEGPAAATVFLFSDMDGWNWQERRVAFALREQGAVVVGIDLPSYLARLEADKGDCVYLVWDMETLSHELQRKGGDAAYHSPILAGVGEGAALALAIVGQTPAATIGRTVAANPTAAVPLRKPLCNIKPEAADGAGTRYGLPQDKLPGAVDVLLTPNADAAGRAHAETLGAGVAVTATRGPAWQALERRLLKLVAHAADEEDDAPPVVELPATPALDTLAIVYSGDGGWRDLDKTIAEYLQAHGVPVVGVDALRYFWTQKKPQDAAADLSELIDSYTGSWKAGKVLLIGYSFGADVLPPMINLLPQAQRDRIVQVSLLGLGNATNFEISVGGWVGQDTQTGIMTVPELRKLAPGLIQCIYGEEDEGAACPRLESTGAEVIKTTGSHHFDGDYDALAERILDGLKQRLGQQAPAN
jgi:type IV secretory pathway VirJ component